MCKAPRLDDQVLLSLIKQNAQVREKAFVYFKRPVMDRIKEQIQINSQELLGCYRKVFEHQFGCNVAKSASNSHATIFKRLLSEIRKAQSGLAPAENGPNENHKAAYLSGELLVQLIAEGNEAVFAEIVRKFSESLMSTLLKKYPTSRESPMEVIGEALITLRENIVNGKLQSPLRASLFSYTCSIANYKFLRLMNRMNKEYLVDYGTALEIYVDSGAIHAKNTYLDFVSDRHPELKVTLFSEGSCFESLIDRLDPVAREILKLRFQENLSHRAIGERLDILEGTSRKRLMDSLEKWRKVYLCKNSEQHTHHSTLRDGQENALRTRRSTNYQKDFNALSIKDLKDLFLNQWLILSNCA